MAQNQLKYLDIELQDFKRFNDSLNMQMEREKKKEGIE